ncbi:MAG: patatin-like phospholipase family protein [Dissulfurispiraceae bacterium]
MPKCDAVFEGGGVKGIGLVGAVSALEDAGYTFENMAGTSAGAIVASLLSVGYTAKEIEAKLTEIDYNDFKDENFLDKLGLIGKGLSIGFEYGIYEGEYFEQWLEGLLKDKGKTKFGDIKTEFPEEKYKYKFQAIASDITDKMLLVLPGDLKSFGYDPDEFSISRAVRMSMSIPIFFEPVKLDDNSGRPHIIIDGGVLSNYPVWLLDDGTSDPAWPTFGFKLMKPDERVLGEGEREPVKNLISYVKSLVGTMLDAHDNYHVSQEKGDFDRTIGIPTVVNISGEKITIGTTDFDITKDESMALFQNGKTSGEAFLKTWDFKAWKKKYR